MPVQMKRFPERNGSTLMGNTSAVSLVCFFENGPHTAATFTFQKMWGCWEILRRWGYKEGDMQHIHDDLACEPTDYTKSPKDFSEHESEAARSSRLSVPQTDKFYMPRSLTCHHCGVIMGPALFNHKHERTKTNATS